jgi:hypothetical protein
MNETDSGLIIWPNSPVKTHDSYYKMHEWITTDLRKYVISYWSFKIVLSIFDSVRAPLVISHHRWNIFRFDVTSFDASIRSSAFGFDWNGQYF